MAKCVVVERFVPTSPSAHEHVFLATVYTSWSLHLDVAKWSCSATRGGKKEMPSLHLSHSLTLTPQNPHVKRVVSRDGHRLGSNISTWKTACQKPHWRVAVRSNPNLLKYFHLEFIFYDNPMLQKKLILKNSPLIRGKAPSNDLWRPKSHVFLWNNDGDKTINQRV